MDIEKMKAMMEAQGGGEAPQRSGDSLLGCILTVIFIAALIGGIATAFIGGQNNCGNRTYFKTHYNACR